MRVLHCRYSRIWRVATRRRRCSCASATLRPEALSNARCGALALAPNMVDARYWLAENLRDQGRASEAREEFEKAAKLDPLAPNIVTMRAHADAERGDFNGAEQRLSSLLEIPQLSERVYGSLVVLCYETGRLARAVDVAKRFLVSTVAVGARPVAHVLGVAYARLGLWEAADYWLDRYADAWSDLLQAELQRCYVLGHGAGALAAQGRYADALGEFVAAVEARRVDLTRIAPYSVANLGVLQAFTGAHAAAIQTLSPLLESPPLVARVRDHMDMQQVLAWAHQRTGDTERANAILDRLDADLQMRADAGQLRTASLLSVFAQNAVLRGECEVAIERLQRATEAGWRDCFRPLHDPRWEALRTEPALEALIGAVKADVDAQRDDVVRSDARDDFRARFARALDAVPAVR
jgi:tetratricopeptide (TPR) repeat protein